MEFGKNKSLNSYQETWFNEDFIAHLEGVFRCPVPLEGVCEPRTRACAWEARNLVSVSRRHQDA